MYSNKKLFLKVWQTLQEHLCLNILFNEVAGLINSMEHGTWYSLIIMLEKREQAIDKGDYISMIYTYMYIWISPRLVSQ